MALRYSPLMTDVTGFRLTNPKEYNMDRFGERLSRYNPSEQFHIPLDWPVLVVEDTEDRISWFRKRMPKAVFAKNAEAALRALEQQDFKVVFLDHDLHWMHADNTIFKGTGKEVARFLAKNGFQGIVIIHSRHVEGAAAMQKYLSNARLAPFGSFEITSEVNCFRQLDLAPFDRLIWSHHPAG